MKDIFPRKTLFVLLVIMQSLLLFEGKAQSTSVADLSADEFDIRFAQDITLLEIYVENIDKTIGIIEKENVLFNRKRARDFSIKEREKLYSLWGNFLDHIITLDTLNAYYKSFYLLPDKSLHSRAFLLAYASYITKFSNTLKFISNTIDNDLYEKKLDDTNSDFGIPGGMYARMKWNTIHVSDVSIIIAGYQYFKFLEKSYEKQGLVTDEKTAPSGR